MNQDFDAMVQESGVDLERIRPLYESVHDCIPFHGKQKVTTGRSPIDGIGLFAQESIARGEMVAMMRRGQFRTPAGRYTNHSQTPNARVIRTDEDFWLVALANISLGDEIVIDYRHTLDLNLRSA